MRVHELLDDTMEFRALVSETEVVTILILSSRQSAEIFYSLRYSLFMSVIAIRRNHRDVSTAIRHGMDVKRTLP